MEPTNFVLLCWFFLVFANADPAAFDMSFLEKAGNNSNVSDK